MRRSDRLFQIIQILRRSKRPVTARGLSDELEVSVRTVYRDIADLMGQRVPIRGEPGRVSERTVWPLLIGYADAVRLLVAWCELRQQFRHFRTDRIIHVGFLDEHHGERRTELVARWKRYMKTSRGLELPE
ncbi:HTH domain-containing protein [Trinickia terrae]|uniref:HTH domain-containing protein n=1 Tax=Trinickia terrae TaxID=2571161 RepID=A0A4U1HW94_9BURK|nr:HTH domain-containing protein [Trinickia terrae]TKC85892.1 HTH domain-containing protein [Trinickia terrae]